MKTIFFFFFLFLNSFFLASQTLYDPQVSYDLSGGLFDEDSSFHDFELLCEYIILISNDNKTASTALVLE